MEDKMDNEEVANVVENEGLAYAIQDYMDHKRIADKKLAKLWKEAREKLDAISEILDWHSEILNKKEGE